jgi:hypothetical protein
MTAVARALLAWLALLPLGCPLLQDDDFVLVPTPMSGPTEGGAAGHAAQGTAGSPEAGASDCDGENWSGRGAVPRPCDSKAVK